MKRQNDKSTTSECAKEHSEIVHRHAIIVTFHVHFQFEFDSRCCVSTNEQQNDFVTAHGSCEIVPSQGRNVMVQMTYLYLFAIL